MNNNSSQIIIPLENEDRLTIRMKNSRTLRAFSKFSPNIIEDNKKLIDICYNNQYSIVLGQEIGIAKSVYKVSTIIPIKSIRDFYVYDLFHSIQSKASIFILPVLGYDRNYFAYNTYFMNCFLGVDEDEYENYESIYLLYRFSGEKDFIDFENKLEKHPMYECTMDVDKYTVMYKCNY